MKPGFVSGQSGLHGGGVRAPSSQSPPSLLPLPNLPQIRTSRPCQREFPGRTRRGIPILPVLERQRQENCEFQASLGYIATFSKDTKTRKTIIVSRGD